MDLPALLGALKRIGGSDLHISGGAPPMARVDGLVRRLAIRGVEVGAYPPLDVRQLVYGVLKDAQKKRLEANRQIDTSLTIGGVGRFRANIFFQDRGLAAVFRAIPDTVVPADKLGLPPVVRALAGAERGLVLVTGPTGSGKSTTLCSLVDEANRTRCGHIITIEDPIEFVHRPQACMVNQREVGTDVPSFADALRAALREDPDIILVGEMRDRETIALAITAAETGHLVLGTLHTASAAKTVDRVVNVFSEGEQAQIRAMFAESIQAVVAQQLLPRRGGGRVAAFEVLVATPAVRALIRDAKTYQLPSVIQTGARHGMQSLEQALSKLVMAGLVEREVAAHKLAALGLERDEPAAGGAGGSSAGLSARPVPATHPAPPVPQPPPGGGGLSGRYAVPGGAGLSGGVSGRFALPGGGVSGPEGGLLTGRFGRPGEDAPAERRKTI